MAEPFTLDGHDIYVTASLGIAVYPGDGSEPEELLKNADTAMYRAKEQGHNNYQFYLPEMNERAMQRLQLETSLRGRSSETNSCCTTSRRSTLPPA